MKKRNKESRFFIRLQESYSDITVNAEDIIASSTVLAGSYYAIHNFILYIVFKQIDVSKEVLHFVKYNKLMAEGLFYGPSLLLLSVPATIFITALLYALSKNSNKFFTYCVFIFSIIFSISFTYSFTTLHQLKMDSYAELAYQVSIIASIIVLLLRIKLINRSAIIHFFILLFISLLIASPSKNKKEEDTENNYIIIHETGEDSPYRAKIIANFDDYIIISINGNQELIFNSQIKKIRFHK